MPRQVAIGSYSGLHTIYSGESILVQGEGPDSKLWEEQLERFKVLADEMLEIRQPVPSGIFLIDAQPLAAAVRSEALAWRNTLSAAQTRCKQESESTINR